MRHAKRTDSNHAAIRQALRDAGWDVEDLSHVGHGVPDLVAEKDERLIWVEIKDGKKSPSARRLTDKEHWFHELLVRCGITVRVVTSVDDVAKL
jgi:Holliday junction resolvase